MTCLLKLIPRAFALTPSLVPGGRLPAGVVDLAVHLVEPGRHLAGRGRGVEAEDRAAPTEVRRELGPLDLAAAVELERDQPGELERPALGHRRPERDRVGAAAARRLIRDVERALELGLQRQAVARGTDRRLDEDLESRLRRRSTCASGRNGRDAQHTSNANAKRLIVSLRGRRRQPPPRVTIATSPNAQLFAGRNRPDDHGGRSNHDQRGTRDRTAYRALAAWPRFNKRGVVAARQRRPRR